MHSVKRRIIRSCKTPRISLLSWLCRSSSGMLGDLMSNAAKHQGKWEALPLTAGLLLNLAAFASGQAGTGYGGELGARIFKPIGLLSIVLFAIYAWRTR